MPPTRLTLVAHTHWDREWYLPFEVMRARLADTLDHALDHLESDPRLSFTLDGHVALVDDYLELRPGAEPRIRALVESGRLHIGPWFTQTDTMIPDGESVLRNLALGLRRADELGGAMRLGYMPDQFGHAAQLPQLFRLCGIDGAVLWRGVGPERPPHAFRWVGPDGSEVMALWLQDGYSSGRRLPSDPQGFADAVDRALERLGDWLGEMPVAFPVGDDHVQLATWLPDAAAAVRARHPELDVQIGGYQHHLPHLGAVEHVVEGELRSSAFAPVLAGVASARMSEKRAAWRAATLLERTAEPLAAMAAEAGAAGASTSDLVRRAWRQLLLNHAHDSIAGCGVDAAHLDVKARYRWAEQLANAACEQALAQLRVAGPRVAGDGAHAIAFHPGPAAPLLTVEATVPRSLLGDLVAVGPDGVARPVQALTAVETRPIFEGDFGAADLQQYLGGLDPTTPLFGRYLQGIAVTPLGDRAFRLDVGLGPTPVAASVLVEEQRRVRTEIEGAERFKVALHDGAPTRPVLLQAGPAPEVSLVPIAIHAGEASATLPRARKLDVATAAIAAGTLTATVEADGTVLVRDEALPLGAVRINDLVDEGDRGDLYHFDPVPGAAPIRPRLVDARVVEAGPVRARLRVQQELQLPLSLTDDRSARTAQTRAMAITSEVSLVAGQRRVEVVTWFDNTCADHRLRALVHVPLRAERLDVHHGLAVVPRPLDTASLGAGAERAAPTGQHHLFVDVSDGRAGVALSSRGLPEHEVLRVDDARATRLALTLVRCVGWLSRGDLAAIDHAAGPMVPTPGAQERGPHRCDYAVLLHSGDWEAGGVMAEARRYEAPAVAVAPRGRADVPAARALVEVAPSSVVLSALHSAETGRGTVVRVLNASSRSVEGTLRPAFHVDRVLEIDPIEQPVASPTTDATLRDGAVQVRLRPWQLVTLLLRREAF